MFLLNVVAISDVALFDQSYVFLSIPRFSPDIYLMFIKLLNVLKPQRDAR